MIRAASASNVVTIGVLIGLGQGENLHEDICKGLVALATASVAAWLTVQRHNLASDVFRQVYLPLQLMPRGEAATA